jgi:dTDP-4-dehydrorhamnose 3,5-epimerase
MGAGRLPARFLLYKVTAGYDPAAERGVIWNDPHLAIPWPVDPGCPMLSDRDLALPPLADCDVWFEH